MSLEYQSTWWTAEIPDNWDAGEDDICITFQPTDGLEAFQVSAYAKEADQVTDDDLKGIAGERLARQTPQPIKTASFEGIFITSIKGEHFQIEWWLKSGNLALYVTYTVQENLAHTRQSVIEGLISGLKPRLVVQ